MYLLPWHCVYLAMAKISFDSVTCMQACSSRSAVVKCSCCRVACIIFSIFMHPASPPRHTVQMNAGNKRQLSSFKQDLVHIHIFPADQFEEFDDFAFVLHWRRSCAGQRFRRAIANLDAIGNDPTFVECVMDAPEWESRLQPRDVTHR